jgi:hypothetical protein
MDAVSHKRLYATLHACGKRPMSATTYNLLASIATLTVRMRLSGQPCGWAGIWIVFPALLTVLALTASSAQQPTVPNVPAGKLVRETIYNEVNDGHTDVKFMFRSRKQTPKGSQTHLYVETEQAMAGILVAVNDHPLTEQQKQAELDHLAWLQNDPDALRKKRAHEKDDSDHTQKIMKALPDAFLYQYDGTVKGTARLGHEGHDLVRLKFTPNPAYSPPSRIEQVLTGMQGTLLIDAEEHRLAEIDGTLFKEVSFLWGIGGHLDKGSTFRVQQADVGVGAWEITDMKLDITGKILFFKSLNMISDEVFSDFQRVPDHTTFAKGVELLKAQEEKFAENSSGPEAHHAQ